MLKQVAFIGIVAVAGLATRPAFAFAQDAAKPPAPATQPAGGKLYAVHLHRPVKVGDTYDISALAAVRRTGTSRVAGEPEKREVVGVGLNLRCKVVVLAVDDRGREQQVECTVRACTKTNGGKAETLLKPGEVFVVTQEGEKTRYRMKGADEDMEPDLAGTLAQAVTLDHPASPTDDEMIGNDRPQPVGASWPASAEAAKKVNELYGFTLDPEGFHQTITLQGVETVRGIECLRIGSESHFEMHAGPPLGKLKLDRLGWVSKFTIDMPTDDKTPNLRKVSTRVETTSFSGRSGPDDRPTHAQNIVETEKEVAYTFPAGEGGKGEK